MKTIEAGDHTIIKCSACEKKLLDILHTDPEPDIEVKIKAICPCGDHSFPIKIKGRFHYSAPIRFVGNTEEVDVDIEDVLANENEVVFVIKDI